MATVIKRKTSTGETRYVVDYRDLSGRRRKERFKRERDARLRLGEVIAQKETGELRARADDVQLKQLVADWRLEHWATIRPNTQAMYSRLLDSFILPKLGERRLRTITLRDIEQLQQHVADSVAKGAYADRSKGGRVSANLALMLVRILLNYAERHRLVASNVARHARRRGPTAEERQAKDSREILTPAELRRLFDAAEGMGRVFLMTAGLTGLRRGELLGLTWPSVEWSTGTLHIRQQMQNGELVPLKTASAKRTVAMPPELVLELKKWRLACPKGPRDLVFCNRNGSALFESNIAPQILRPALRRAGLREVTLHELRHGFGSILISSGVSVKVVQVAMGHSSPSITLQVYTHMMRDDGAAVGRTLSARVFGGHFLDTSRENAAQDGVAAGTNT